MRAGDRMILDHNDPQLATPCTIRRVHPNTRRIDIWLPSGGWLTVPAHTLTPAEDQ